MKSDLKFTKVLLFLLLSFVGGLIEIYSLKIHGIFAGMQTGNLITMLINFIDGSYNAGLYRLTVILIFIFGLFLNRLMFKLLKGNEKKHYTITLILEGLFLIPLIFIPKNNNETIINFEPNQYDYIANAFIALFGAFQFSAFTKISVYPINTTMMTGNMRSFIFTAVDLIFEKGKEKAKMVFFYIASFIVFIIGAVVFYVSFKYYNGDLKELFISLFMILPIVITFICIPLAYKTFNIS